MDEEDTGARGKLLDLDLTQIRQAETEISRQYDPEAFEGRTSQFKVVLPATLDFKIRKDKTRYRLIGRLKTRLELSCSRCLERYPVTVDSTFDVRYLPQSENTGTSEQAVDDGDLADAFYLDEQIDLQQLMEEQFYLTIPMKPLCRADCKGLCPTCGVDLNDGACNCTVQWEDPRLAGLRMFLNRDNPDA